MESVHPEPEVAEGVGKLTASGTLYTLQLAFSYDNRARVVEIGLQQQGYVLWEVLVVSIHSDGIGEAHLNGLLESVLQGSAFSLVFYVFYEGYSCCLSEQLFSSVCAAVIDNNDIPAQQ